LVESFGHVFDGPWQEIRDAVCGVVCDDAEYMAQLGIRIDAVQFGGPWRRHDPGRPGAARV